MRIRSTLTLFFIAVTISSMFFLFNFSHAHPNDEEVEELKQQVEELKQQLEEMKQQLNQQGEQIQTNTEGIQQNADDIEAEQMDRKDEDRQDVYDAYDDAIEEAVGAVPGSEPVMIAKKGAEAVEAEVEYQEKYGETLTGRPLSEARFSSGSCSGSCSTAPPPYWCSQCNTLHTRTYLGLCDGNVH